MPACREYPFTHSARVDRCCPFATEGAIFYTLTYAWTRAGSTKGELVVRIYAPYLAQHRVCATTFNQLNEHEGHIIH